MKLYNDQLNAQVFSLFYLSIYFCLTCFGLSFRPSSEAGVQLRQWVKSPWYGVSARVLTPYTANRACEPVMAETLMHHSDVAAKDLNHFLPPKKHLAAKRFVTNADVKQAVTS
jgi:hypothetical protein